MTRTCWFKFSAIESSPPKSKTNRRPELTWSSRKFFVPLGISRTTSLITRPTTSRSGTSIVSCSCFTPTTSWRKSSTQTFWNCLASTKEGWIQFQIIWQPSFNQNACLTSSNTWSKTSLSLGKNSSKSQAHRQELLSASQTSSVAGPMSTGSTWRECQPSKSCWTQIEPCCMTITTRRISKSSDIAQRTWSSLRTSYARATTWLQMHHSQTRPRLPQEPWLRIWRTRWSQESASCSSRSTRIWRRFR